MKFEKFFLSIFAILHFVIYFVLPQGGPRYLIDYDDKTFVAPLINMSWNEYWDIWFPNRNNYAFPFRDLSFWIDMKLSAWVGFPTYWLTNWILVAVIAYSAWQILKIYFPQNIYYRFWIFAISFSHPLLVEVIQWASIRKHILVGALLAMPTYWVLRAHHSKLNLSSKLFKFSIGLWLLSLATWPSGLLWITWFLFLTRRKIKIQNWNFALVFSAIFGFMATRIAGGGSDYSGGAETLLSQEGILRAVENGFFSLGRGFFDFFFPFYLQPYFDIRNNLNYLGWPIIIGLLIGFGIWHFRQGLKGLELLLLAALFFIPQCLVFLTYHEFVWSDRYFFLSLIPFNVFLYLNLHKIFDYGKFKFNPLIYVFWLVPPIFLYLTYVNIPRWYDDLNLMQSCYEQEGSSKCLVLSLEKKYDREQCMGAAPYIEAAQKKHKSGLHGSEFELTQQMLFYDALCTVDLTNYSLQQRRDYIDQLASKFPTETVLDFFKVLLALEEKNRPRAFMEARALYLDPSRPLKLNTKFANVLRGQTGALCELVSTLECEQLKQTFFNRINFLSINQSRIDWGYSKTQMSYGR